jgi:hypothetical protein
MNESFRFNTVLSRITQAIVWVYQGIAVVVFIASLILGAIWIGKPFIGGFLEQTMVLNGSDTSEPGKHWSLYAQNFHVGEQLISVNGQRVFSEEDLRAAIGSAKLGDTLPIEIRKTDGANYAADVTLTPFPVADVIAYFILPMFLSLVFLVLSLWIFGLRRSESSGRAFSMMTTSLALVTGTLFDLYTTHQFTILWTLAAAFSGGALIDLGLCFPQEARFLFRRPYLRWLRGWQWSDAECLPPVV